MDILYNTFMYEITKITDWAIVYVCKLMFANKILRNNLSLLEIDVYVCISTTPEE